MFDFTTSPDRHGTGSLKWDKYKGRDVIPLWVADMDFTSPPAVLDALRRRVDHGVFGYTLPTEEAIGETLNYLRRAHGIDAAPEWLVWLPGLVPALNLACRTFGNPGDAVMIHTPVYPPFLSAPHHADRRRLAVPLLCRDGAWHIDFDAMEAAVTPDTRLFIFCHPHNPVGRVWSAAEIDRLLDFCARHDLVLVSDEIHCDLLLEPDLPFTPTLTRPGAAARTIALYAPSKTYNLPGLACAFAVIPDDTLRAAFKKTARGIITEINAFGYAGCAAAFRDGEPWRRALLDVLRSHRDLVFATARDHMPGVVMHPMQATYLAWLDVRGLNLDTPGAFFEDAGVGLSNGIDFGTPGFLRLNFGCPRPRLEQALDRMTRALSARA